MRPVDFYVLQDFSDLNTTQRFVSKINILDYPALIRGVGPISQNDSEEGPNSYNPLKWPRMSPQNASTTGVQSKRHFASRSEDQELQNRSSSHVLVFLHWVFLMGLNKRRFNLRLTYVINKKRYFMLTIVNLFIRCFHSLIQLF